MNFTPEHFSGSDSDRLQAAVDAAAAAGGGRVVVEARAPDEASPRNYWLLERALLVHANITLVLRDCRLKLANCCRDNIIRSANCGAGVAEIKPLCNVHIIGEGRVILEGADRPRASGDGAKTLSVDNVRVAGGPFIPVSYGTDAQIVTEKQTGDWRNIGVLLAQVHDFSLRGITVADAHAWAISLEHCSAGTICDITISASGGRNIDGAFQTILNQDGLDLRQGCHDITIDGIAGNSGDDLVALTAIRRVKCAAGSLDSTMVSGSGYGDARDDVYNIIIRNVRGTAGGHHVVRFLNNGGIVMRGIILDGVVGAAMPERPDRAVVLVGDGNKNYGGPAALGETRAFMISNICGQARHLVEIRGTLSDSVLTNLLYNAVQGSAVSYTSGVENTRNVVVGPAVCAE